jgi:hypothetical protein
MNILVMSDTHGDGECVRKLLDIYAGSVQMVFHMGDNARDLLNYKVQFPDLGMYAVAGNCDYGDNLPQELLLPLHGRRLLLTHGHRQNVKMNLDRLAYYAEEKNADACLFGHTHKAEAFDRGSIYFINPGSAAEPRAGERPSYGLLSVSEQGLIKGKIIRL